MSATLQLLQRYKDFKGLRSNYAAAKALGISESTISGWVHGGTMDQAIALQIAQEIGSEPLATLAQVQLERPLSDRERRVWSRYCARVLVAALATLAAAAAVEHPAEASYHAQKLSTFDNLYIMRRLDWVQRFIAQLNLALRRCRVQRLRPWASSMA